ncbi:hypothetical protein [Nocardia sp. NPDC003726]
MTRPLAGGAEPLRASFNIEDGATGSTTGNPSAVDAEIVLAQNPVVSTPPPVPQVPGQELRADLQIPEAPKAGARVYMGLWKYAELGLEGDGQSLQFMITGFAPVALLLGCGYVGLSAAATIYLVTLSFLVQAGLVFMVLVVRGKHSEKSE